MRGYGTAYVIANLVLFLVAKTHSIIEQYSASVYSAPIYSTPIYSHTAVSDIKES
jgi:hypothetical protein